MAWRLKQITPTQEIWECRFYTDLTRKVINNFAEFFQPYNPKDKHFIADYKANLSKNIVIHMPQSEIFSVGFGKPINLLNFPIVENFFWGLLALDYGSYTYQNFLDKKVVVVPKQTKAKDKPNKIEPDLYSELPAGLIGQADGMFIYGTVGFTLLPTTVFTLTSRSASVEGEVIVTPDNWDYNSKQVHIQALNGIVKSVMGASKHNIKKEIIIDYQGKGKIMKHSVPWDVSIKGQPVDESLRRSIRSANPFPLMR